MMRQKMVLAMVAGVFALSLGSSLYADTTVAIAGRVAITPHVGLGVWIGGPAKGPVRHAPVHERVVITKPWRHRFIRLGPPRAETVVAPPRHIVVDRPPVVVPRAPTVVADGPITVWITNSNGSRTCVKLTRHGSCYIGPRGEYYRGMPTNEQLRTVYGF
jgi:hypothetical protein